MDLLDFSGEDMYFDQPLPAEVEALIARAAERYGSDEAELCLLRAYFLAPTHLSVLVALYRFYYYRQRLPEALTVADRAIAAAARGLGLDLGADGDWRRLDDESLGQAVMQSMTLTRFLLLALKGSGYLLMRMDRPAEALERLEKVAAFDTGDRLGLTELLSWARTAAARSEIGARGDNVEYIRR
jgi:hypothetical protein